MRIEKQFLVKEVAQKLSDTEYIYLVDFSKVTVLETAELRSKLSKEGAHFHVVKNTILRKVGEDFKWPSFTHMLAGQTAVIFGGKNPSGVIKIILSFVKEKDKLAPKGGLLDGQLYGLKELEALSKLPDLATLRATFLSLLLTPYRQCLYVMHAVPQGLLNVLKAYEEKK